MIRICLLLLFLFSTSHIFSQLIINDDFSSFLNDKFKQQTFYIQQFIDRFNFDEPIILNNKPTNSRKSNLLLLVNREDSLLIDNPLLYEFIEEVSSDSNKTIIINRFEKNWFALATGNFIYKNKPLKVEMKLILSGNLTEGFNWIIDSVYSTIFTTPIKNYSLYINPLNNEINFSDLSRGLENAKDVWSYTKDVKYNALISFSDYVKNGDLIFTHISKLRYYFINIDGYNFTVDYYMRTSKNAGWLISTITKY